nr:E3 SUMO-protein ligase PIAS2-like [Penaeus vannamei]
MTRMTLPCRASTCKHIQCFDALVYIRMNECKPTWICPVCNCAAHFSDLRIDGYFQDILQKDRSSTKIKFHSNGTWSPVLSSEPEEPAPEIPKNIPVSKRKFSQVDEVIVIDLEDEDPVTRKDPLTDRNNNSLDAEEPQEIDVERDPATTSLQPPNARDDSPRRRRSSRNSVSSVQIPVVLEPLAKRMRTRSTNRKNSQTNEECISLSADNTERRASRNSQTSRRRHR